MRLKNNISDMRVSCPVSIVSRRGSGSAKTTCSRRRKKSKLKISKWDAMNTCAIPARTGTSADLEHISLGTSRELRMALCDENSSTSMSSKGIPYVASCRATRIWRPAPLCEWPPFSLRVAVVQECLAPCASPSKPSSLSISGIER